MMFFGARPRAWLVGLGLSLLGLGCADVEHIERGVCGNGVLEPGEDCDSFAPTDGTQCGTTGPSACHYECIPGTTGGKGPAANCPAGWGCGADAICRKPTGEFDLVDLPLSHGGDYLSLADFDGDHRADVLSVDSTQTTIDFYDQQFNLAHEFVLPSVITSPAVGDVNGDGRADLLFKYAKVSGDLAILLGAEDATLRRHVYPAQTLTKDAQVRFFNDKGIFSLTIDSLFVIADADAGYPAGTSCDGAACIFLDALGLLEQHLVTLPKPVKELARDIVTANFAEQGLPCAQFALAFRKEAEVRVYQACLTEGIGNGPPAQDSAPVIVKLPSGVQVASADEGPGLMTADLNGDGHIDLLINGPRDAEPMQVYVAYGTGLGTFSSTPGGAVDNLASLFEPSLPEDVTLSQALATGNLDDDGVPDFVTSTGIWLSSVADFGCNNISYCASGAAWDGAMIVDVNGDNRAEVIATSQGRQGVELFYNLGGGVLTESFSRTDERISQWERGDFDGDGLLDVAVAGPSASNQSGMLSDSLSILFGRREGPFSSPVSVGRFNQVEQLTRLDQLAFQQDFIDDLSVLSRAPSGERSLAVIQGGTDRQLFAPYGLSSGKLRGFPTNNTVLGQFTPDSEPDLATLGFSFSGQDGSETAQRLWLAPGAVGDQLGTPSASDPLKYAADEALLAASDLDRDGRDEVVLLTPKNMPSEVTVSSPSGGLGDMAVQLIIAHAKDGSSSTAFTIDEGTDVDISLPIPNRSIDQYRLTDVDGDGWQDLLVPQVFAPLVYWGTEGGGFDYANPLTLSLPKNAPILQVAWLHRDVSRERELLLGGLDALYVLHFDGKTPSTAERLSLLLDDLGSDYTLATADVNGDGLEDIVLESSDGLRVLAGRPVEP